ncbi:UDP-glycosyltransferase 92A1-like, partial [Papaver somniferum]|uniref:UDP-glycosyltransferase 92A1-like n=1 Tax=Papaver somniferum TaxID=3469 RepID=UPI000E6F9621
MFTLLDSKLGQNVVWAVGLVSDYSLALNESEITTTSSDIIQWLENHENSSVLYISFGSQDTISKSQIMELATIGLEKSDKNFIWVIRPPLGFDINVEFRSEWLPGGFEERMKEKNKGLLVRKCAPQLEILSHKSTSVFLSHCRWNSVLESLYFGVPIIGWSLSADQPSNSRLLEEEIGVCVELAKGNRNEVKHEDVVRLLDLVMNKKDLEMRKKAFKIREMIKNAIREDEGLEGSSVKGIKKFFEAALLRKKEMMKMGRHGN